MRQFAQTEMASAESAIAAAREATALPCAVELTTMYTQNPRFGAWGGEETCEHLNGGILLWYRRMWRR